MWLILSNVLVLFLKKKQSLHLLLLPPNRGSSVHAPSPALWVGHVCSCCLSWRRETAHHRHSHLESLENIKVGGGKIIPKCAVSRGHLRVRRARVLQQLLSETSHMRLSVQGVCRALHCPFPWTWASALKAHLTDNKPLHLERGITRHGEDAVTTQTDKMQ